MIKESMNDNTSDEGDVLPHATGSDLETYLNQAPFEVLI